MDEPRPAGQGHPEKGSAYGKHPATERPRAEQPTAERQETRGTEAAEQRVADVARTAEHAVAGALHRAEEFVRADMDETRQEWHDQWANDRAELRADVARDKREVAEAADEVRHPERLAAAAEKRLEEDAAQVQAAEHVLTHPKVLEAEVNEAVAEKKAAFDRTTATIAAEFTSPADARKLPVVMKVFGVLLIIVSLAALPGASTAIYRSAMSLEAHGLGNEGVSTVVVNFLHLGVLVALALTAIIFGYRLLRNQRRWAAIISYGLCVLLTLGVLCSIMLQGITIDLVFYLVAFVVTIALQSYLDPSLLEERRHHRQAREAEEHKEGEAGTLGRDLSGKGYITLNFFNLFWIFVVASVLGLIMEEVTHFLFVVPGQWQDRAGLLFGPFSPIYGCGAVLMTVFLNRFHKSNFLIIFVVAAVIGGGFEALTSLFMQYAYGAVAWDYSNMPGSLFGGRTCLPFMAIWGLLGVVWIKLALPFMLRLVNFIPWNWRYVLTTVCAALMLVDAVMTLQALDCWYERLSGAKVDTPIQQFYDHNFDNTVMADRFQSMTIVPSNAVRG